MSEYSSKTSRSTIPPVNLLQERPQEEPASEKPLESPKTVDSGREVPTEDARQDKQRHRLSPKERGRFEELRKSWRQQSDIGPSRPYENSNNLEAQIPHRLSIGTFSQGKRKTPKSILSNNGTENSKEDALTALPSLSDGSEVEGTNSMTDSHFRHMEDLVTNMNAVPRYDPENELKTAGKWRVAGEKYCIILAVLVVNFIFVFCTWWWPRYYYIYLPFITITVVLNSVMVVSIMFFTTKHKIFPEKKIIPERPESLVYVVPVYNETPDEISKSIDSLADQINIDQHQRAMIIICDGRVRGPGMAKTTADYLLDDLLLDRKSRRFIHGAYIGWTQEVLDVEVQEGVYKGVPYFCIIKQQNQGKRDSLIVVRSFLYKFNLREERPQVIFSPQFFASMATFLLERGRIQHVDYLIGLDGDTLFADDCISELIKESHYPNTVGVCGYVAVDFTRGTLGQWNPWNLYQSAEYTISQGLRRLHQSIVTHKVSCLPGCCQLLRVCETTCGDKILLELFGYCPKPTDNMLTHIRATASEDRNHVCNMLSAFPKAQTRQALKARAFTDVPHSWSVFLSQRRRWTLGATTNDMFLVFAPGIYWFERILAFANCLVWFVNIFVFASIACFVAAIIRVQGWIILCFSSVMLVPVLYYIAIIIWLPRTARERLRYGIGLLMYLIGGPFINIIVLSYALFNMDSFGWGKTRVVVSDPVTGEQRVTIPTGERKKAYSSASPRTSTLLKNKIVVIVGCSSTSAQQLLKAFGKRYLTIGYDPSEEVMMQVQRQISGADGYHIEITSNKAELCRGNVYIITTPVNTTPDNVESEASSMMLSDAIDIIRPHAKTGDTVFIDSVEAPVGTTSTFLRDFQQCGVLCGYSPAPSVRQGVFTDSKKIISAFSEEGLKQMEQIYRPVFPRLIAVPSPEFAEVSQVFAKLHADSQEVLANAAAESDDGESRIISEKMSSMLRLLIVEAENGLEQIRGKSGKNRTSRTSRTSRFSRISRKSFMSRG